MSFSSNGFSFLFVVSTGFVGFTQAGYGQTYSTEFALNSRGESSDLLTIDAKVFGLDPNEYRLSEIMVKATHSLDGQFFYNGPFSTDSAASQAFFYIGDTANNISDLNAGSFSQSSSGNTQFRFNTIDLKLDYENQPINTFSLGINSYRTSGFPNSYGAGLNGTLETSWLKFSPDQQHLIIDFGDPGFVETSLLQPVTSEYGLLFFDNPTALADDSAKIEQFEIVGQVQKYFDDAEANVKVFHDDDRAKAKSEISSTVYVYDSIIEYTPGSPKKECPPTLADYGLCNVKVEVPENISFEEAFERDNDGNLTSIYKYTKINGEARPDPENKTSKTDNAWVYTNNIERELNQIEGRIVEDFVPMVIAHEAGHLFGVGHEENDPSEDRFIMQEKLKYVTKDSFSPRSSACLRRNINGENINCFAGFNTEEGPDDPYKDVTVDLKGVLNGENVVFAVPNSSVGDFALGYSLLEPLLLDDGSFGFEIPEFEGFGAFLGRSYNLLEGEPELYDVALDWNGQFDGLDPFGSLSLFELGFTVGYEDLSSGYEFQKNWIAIADGLSLFDLGNSTVSILGNSPVPTNDDAPLSSVPLPTSGLMFIASLFGLTRLGKSQLRSRAAKTLFVGGYTF